MIHIQIYIYTHIENNNNKNRIDLYILIIIVVDFLSFISYLYLNKSSLIIFVNRRFYVLYKGLLMIYYFYICK